LIITGDSIARSLVPDSYMSQLYRQYGFAGVWCSNQSAFGGPMYGLNVGGAASGTTTATNRWSTYFHGQTFSMTAAGNIVSFNMAIGPGGAKPFNKATVVYAKRSGGGIFKLQTLREDATNDSTDFVDVVGATAIDTSSVTETIATHVVNMPANEKGRVRAAWVSGGEVEIIGCLME